ncbi:hypothetical protein B0H16DRAFT_304938 [Mycena metata]|uniref:Uncharacterized protein n=1 Tax=Mycena metata TaxID=1033252 RepID=A0AAD7KHA9_9AGAR|nr:hypothetical protein B0H16DRAFT_304938 [Mycena metata]
MFAPGNPLRGIVSLFCLSNGLSLLFLRASAKASLAAAVAYASLSASRCAERAWRWPSMLLAWKTSLRLVVTLVWTQAQKIPPTFLHAVRGSHQIGPSLEPVQGPAGSWKCPQGYCAGHRMPAGWGLGVQPLKKVSFISIYQRRRTPYAGQVSGLPEDSGGRSIQGMGHYSSGCEQRQRMG